jgi:hypothetical protein
MVGLDRFGEPILFGVIFSTLLTAGRAARPRQDPA